MLGLAVFLLGAFPKATGAVWGFFGLSFFLSFVGRVLDLPDWFKNFSPFNHIPQLPTQEITFAPLAILTVIAIILTAIGFVCYTKRDTQG